MHAYVGMCFRKKGHACSILDISKDEIKAAKIAHHYTKFNLLYKNLKTNQNPKFFYCKNSSVGIFPNDTICQNKLQNF